MIDYYLISLSGSYPFTGSAKDIFRKILNGKIEYNEPEWEQVSMNGKVCNEKLIITIQIVFLLF